MLFIALFAIILLTILILFSFPQFSPIPYFPSNKKDLPLIIKSFNLKKNQTIIDLGAGDGMVIFKAAKEAIRKKLNTKFIAIEINPVLLCILYFRRLLEPNRKNIKIVYGDIFTFDYHNFMYGSVVTDPYNITFYLYISPWHLEKTVNNVKHQFKQFSIVSYIYPVKSLSKKERKIKGNIHTIYMYNI